MLARLQQLTTLGLLALALCWLGWFGALGHWGMATLGALVICTGHALFLGLEMLLAAWQHGDDPAPRAGPLQLLRAWWGEVLTAPQVFCWRQPFRSNVHADHLGAHARDLTGVVLVHGFVCNRGFWNPWMAELRQRGVPFVAVNLEPPFGSIEDYADLLDAAVRRVTLATGKPPLIVAHSMGGLAVRHWRVTLGASTPLRHVITIASPHAGTWLARFAFSPNGRQMRRAGAWLAALADAECRQRGASPWADFTCYHGHADNIVFPPSTATLPGADNRHLAACAHVDMAFQPAVFSEVLRWLSPEPSARHGRTAQ